MGNLFYASASHHIRSGEGEHVEEASSPSSAKHIYSKLSQLDISNITERIELAYSVLKHLQQKNSLKSIRDRKLRARVDKANRDMYDFLLLISEYVTDYYGSFEALDIQQQENWSIEERQEKTKEFLFAGTPSLIQKIVTSMKKCVDHMNALLIVSKPFI